MRVTYSAMFDDDIADTAYVAPRRPKSESMTHIPTDRTTDGRTDTRSYRVALSQLRIVRIFGIRNDDNNNNDDDDNNNKLAK